MTLKQFKKKMERKHQANIKALKEQTKRVLKERGQR